MHQVEIGGEWAVLCFAPSGPPGLRARFALEPSPRPSASPFNSWNSGSLRVRQCFGFAIVGRAKTSTRAVNGNPLATSYILDWLAPGTTIQRRIDVSNSTHSDARFAVYPAATGLSRGNFSFASGHSRNELSRWTTVDHSTLHLPPGRWCCIFLARVGAHLPRCIVHWVTTRGSAMRVSVVLTPNKRRDLQIIIPDLTRRWIPAKLGSSTRLDVSNLRLQR
jgi:hypothetical protein